MMFDVVTIFPSIFDEYFNLSIMKRAADKSLVRFRVHDLRDFTHDRHRKVDDAPYGGGAGMVMKAEPIIEAVEEIKKDGMRRKVVLVSPQGRLFTQTIAEDFRRDGQALLFICGRYEGIDERVKSVVDDELSLGDYILTGGELAALVIIDTVVRLIPGALGDDASAIEESFSWGILDYPHYTRPGTFRDMAVPEVLLSGNHREIWLWRRKQALRNTLLRRPDLLENVELTARDRQMLIEIKEELNHEQDPGN
ncbi:MAG: tRNA (guanosine(37)-N1)-methyltransferase TrmD [bacterium]